jgi:hypothetical protein
MPFYASDFSDKRIQGEMDALRDLATARREFFRNIGQFNRRDQLTRMFLDSEVSFVQAVQARQVSPIHINFPLTISPDGTFTAAVPVIPSAEQIANEIEDFMSSSQQTCAICQDVISSDGARLRVCQHVYHRSCIQSWFCASVRCPVCRRDIREDPATQTSSAAIETQSQQTYQWGGAESPE